MNPPAITTAPVVHGVVEEAGAIWFINTKPPCVVNCPCDNKGPSTNNPPAPIEPPPAPTFRESAASEVNMPGPAGVVAAHATRIVTENSQALPCCNCDPLPCIRRDCDINKTIIPCDCACRSCGASSGGSRRRRYHELSGSRLPCRKKRAVNRPSTNPD